MKTIRGAMPVPIRSALAGLICLLTVAACATNPAPATSTEAVDVGYGGTEPAPPMPAVNTIRDDDAYAAHPPTLAEMLRRIPGVRVIEMVEGGMTVRIRGASSFLASEEPLWVIDGMVMPPVDGGLDLINPNNIRSITVLKNADATAIYGSRGANGVILIRTKQG